MRTATGTRGRQCLPFLLRRLDLTPCPLTKRPTNRLLEYTTCTILQLGAVSPRLAPILFRRRVQDCGELNGSSETDRNRRQEESRIFLESIDPSRDRSSHAIPGFRLTIVRDCYLSFSRYLFLDPPGASQHSRNPSQSMQHPAERDVPILSLANLPDPFLQLSFLYVEPASPAHGDQCQPATLPRLQP